MRCNSCGEYIYKGRKFNARKETVEGESYLGIRIFRFYIRCPTCGAEITYKTDPKNTDYECEFGAKRNFEPWREEKAEEEKAKARRLLEEEHNPMKALENKTFDAKRELDIAEALDEIRTMNARLEQVDADEVFERVTMDPVFVAEDAIDEQESERLKREREEDEAIIKAAFNSVQQQEAEPEVSPDDLLTSLQMQGGLKPLSKPTTDKPMPQKRRLDAASLGIVPKKKPAP